MPFTDLGSLADARGSTRKAKDIILPKYLTRLLQCTQLTARSRLSKVLHFARRDRLAGGVYELLSVGIPFVEELSPPLLLACNGRRKRLRMNVLNGTDVVISSEVGRPGGLRWFFKSRLYHAVDVSPTLSANDALRLCHRYRFLRTDKNKNEWNSSPRRVVNTGK